MDKIGRLQDIAMKEFAEKGYEGVSLNEILRETGMSKGSFYHNYKSKEELYMSLVGKVIDEKWQHMHDSDLLVLEKCSLFTLLRNQILAAFSFVDTKPQYQKFSESVMKEKNEDLRQRVFSRFKLENRNRLLHLVEAAVHSGEIRDDIPVEHINDILTFFLQNITEISSLVHMGDYVKLSDWLLNFLENGLRRR